MFKDVIKFVHPSGVAFEPPTDIIYLLPPEDVWLTAKEAVKLGLADQIVTYYAQAVEAIGTNIPFVIQDYPLTLSVIMTPKVIQKIIMDNPSCVMLKHEDWPGLEKISALRKFETDGT